MSINKVVITGNLTRDCESRQTASGFSICNFSVAVNDRRKNQQTGAWEDYANFVDCTLLGKRAESLAQYLTKGTKVAVEGKLHWSQWQAQDGSKRSKLDVTVDDIELLSSRQQTQAPAYAPAPAPAYAPAPQQTAYYDEEVPF